MMMRSMSNLRASADRPETTALTPFLCRTSDSLWVGIERALDNGLGVVLVADAEGRFKGKTDLTAMRACIRSGQHLGHLSLGDVVQSATAAQSSEPSLLQPQLDPAGCVVGVTINRAATFLPVAEPDLSHLEFRDRKSVV